jgi:hypothetical protein
MCLYIHTILMATKYPCMDVPVYTTSPLLIDVWIVSKYSNKQPCTLIFTQLCKFLHRNFHELELLSPWFANLNFL